MSVAGAVQVPECTCCCRQAWQAGVEATLQDAALWPAVRAAHPGTAEGLQGLLELFAGSPDRQATIPAQSCSRWLPAAGSLQGIDLQ